MKVILDSMAESWDLPEHPFSHEVRNMARDDFKHVRTLIERLLKVLFLHEISPATPLAIISLH